MSASPNQLEEIYQQLKDNFLSHPLVSVYPTKGTPPEQYEISYTISGMSKNTEGEIVESIDHTVEIAIPFGFPHFPPSCKPKSDIYHPDFDPAAICLGDFWEQDRSLSELIIYIGKMINGESYTTTNAFNEEAAAWYQNNSGKFPFTQIVWDVENGLKSSPSANSHDIDTLDDADLATEFDFLAMEGGGDEEEIILSTSFPDVDSSNDFDLELFHQLERQRKYYTLLRDGEVHASSSKELKQLCQTAKDKIQKAEKLHRDAKKFESKGSARVALEKYQQITTIISDFPVIDADIQRVKQTLALLDDLSPDLPEDLSDSPDPSEAYTSEETTVTEESLHISVENKRTRAATKAKVAQSQATEDAFFPKKSSKNKPYLLLGLLTICIGCGGYLWYAFSSKLSKAEEAYAHCSTSYANNHFVAAKDSCDNALKLVGEVKFIHQDFAQQLEKFILEILQSEKLTQGLAGNVLINGKYIPKAEAQTLQSLNKLRGQADALFLEEKWQPAMDVYRTLRSQLENNNYFDQSTTEDIERKSLITEFRMSYDPARLSIQNKRWEEAIEKLLQAQKILVSLPEADRGQYSKELQDALQKSQFANLKEQGDQSFTGEDWLSAIDSYNLALSRGQQAALSPQSIAAIRNNIKRAEIYTTINKGNKAFAARSWDNAIAEYSKASGLLMGSQIVGNDTTPDINISKLARIILQASIIRDRQIVETLLENDELKKARKIYRQILANINKSSFRTEEEFTDTTAEINKALKKLNKELFLQNKVAYLKDNYQALFIANYPSSDPDKLVSPVITNTKETKTKWVFRMQCTDIGGSRPLNLVMHYAYDKKSQKWKLYSD